MKKKKTILHKMCVFRIDLKDERKKISEIDKALA